MKGVPLDIYTRWRSLYNMLVVVKDTKTRSIFVEYNISPN